MVGDSLVIGLAEQSDSGYSGVAILTPDGESTVVTVYVTSTAAEEEEEEGGDEAAAGGEAIDIVDFAFAPAELTVPVGTTVTWTNQDSAPHTVTADDGAFDSGRMDQGATFSFTFDTAGTYAYHCDFHPNMTATITVE
jgi:plastocyanin